MTVKRVFKVSFALIILATTIYSRFNVPRVAILTQTIILKRHYIEILIVKVNLLVPPYFQLFGRFSKFN